MKEKLVVIGNGMAGMRTIEELLEVAPDLYDITVFGAEPYGNYNRILLSPVLAGEKTIDEIMLNDLDWYAAHGITLYKGRTVMEIRRDRKVVIADDGSETPFDILLIATGSEPVILPLPGKDLKGVINTAALWLQAQCVLRRVICAGIARWQPKRSSIDRGKLRDLNRDERKTRRHWQRYGRDAHH